MTKSNPNLLAYGLSDKIVFRHLGSNTVVSQKAKSQARESEKQTAHRKHFQQIQNNEDLYGNKIILTVSDLPENVTEKEQFIILKYKISTSTIQYEYRVSTI